MLRLLLPFFLIIAFSEAAVNYNDTLKRADKLLKSSNKTEIFRAYNDYKNLYLHAVINKDDHLLYRSLAGIVKSGKTLHIDVTKYSREFSGMKQRGLSGKKHTAVKNKTGREKKVAVVNRHRLKSARWKNGRIFLEFDKPLKNKELNYFKLYDKQKRRYRYVFDMHSSMIDKQYTLHHAKIRRITLAQYRPDTLRFVIENDKPLSIRFKKEKRLLVVNPGVASSQGQTEKKFLPTESKKVKSRIIVLDPGHGGKDAGAVGYRGYREKMVVLQIAREVSKILKETGHKVYMTRTDDRFVKLMKRTKYANRKNADLFISIHANAVPKRNAHKAIGIETYFLSNNVDAGSARAKRVAKMENSKDLKDVNYFGQQDFINILNREKIKKSERLAHDLQRNILGTLKKNYKGVVDAGVREGPFWVLVGAQMPAVLIEVGFITHPTEAKRIVNKKYQKQMAEGIARGIEQYFLNNP